MGSMFSWIEKVIHGHLAMDNSLTTDMYVSAFGNTALYNSSKSLLNTRKITFLPSYIG